MLNCLKMGDEDVDYVSSRLGDQAPILITARSYGNRSRMSISSVRSTNTSLLGNNALLPGGGGSKLPSILGKSPRASNALSITTNSKSPRISVMSEDDFFVPVFSEKTLVSQNLAFRNGRKIATFCTIITLFSLEIFKKKTVVLFLYQQKINGVEYQIVWQGMKIRCIEDLLLV